MGGAPAGSSTGMDDEQYQRWKSGTLQTPTAPVAPPTPGYLSRVGSDYGAAGTSITDTLAKNAEVQRSAAPVAKKLGSEISTGFNTAGDVAGATFAPINQAPGVHQAMEGIGKTGTAISDKLMKIPGYSQFFEGLSQHLDANPGEAHTIGSAVNLAMLGLGGEGEAPVVDAGKTLVEGTRSAVSPLVTDTVGAVKHIPDSIAKAQAAFEKASVGKVVKSRIKELDKLESGNAVVRKAIANAGTRGIDVKDIVANTDLLQGAVDKSGTLRTTQDGGAVDQLNEFIKPQEGVISQTLEREGKTVPLADLEKTLVDAVGKSSVKGGAKIRALKNAAQDIEGYKLDAVDAEGKPWVEGESQGEPHIPLKIVHDAKVDKYANIDYTNPESAKTDKVIAKALKETVEKNTDSVDAKALNEELSSHYATLGFLEKLDGKKVAGGRLGKYFAQTVGSIVGSHFGPLGGIIGAEAGGLLKGAQMEQTFGKGGGTALEQSDAMKAAIEANQSSKSEGNRNTAQATNSTNDIPSSVAPEDVVSAAHQSIVDNGGVTISPTGDQPTSGYAYAPAKDTEFSVPKEYFNTQHIADFVEKNADLLTQPGNHIGGWESDGKVYLDISRVGEPSAKTLDEAQKASQLAAFDLSNFKEIPLGKIENGVYTALDEASAIHDSHSRENSAANSEGGDGGIPEGAGEARALTEDQQKVRDSKEFKDFPRNENVISPEEKAVEDSAIVKYLSQKKEMLAQYLKDHGNLVNTDEARKYFTDIGYNGTNSQSIQEAASQLAKDALAHLIEKNTGSGKNGYYMAGSSGAGKTHATTNMAAEFKKAAFVLDGNLSNPTTALSKIATAEAAGLLPTIVHIWREPVEAWKDGVVDRMLGSGESAGRVVPLKEFLKNLVGSLSTVKKAIGKGIPVTGIHNSMDGTIKSNSMSAIRKLEIPPSVQAEGIAYVEGLAKGGSVTKDQYEALLAGIPHKPYEAIADKP